MVVTVAVTVFMVVVAHGVVLRVRFIVRAQGGSVALRIKRILGQPIIYVKLI